MTSVPDTATTRALRQNMVDGLVSEGDLRDPRWMSAFRTVPRHCFVPRYYPANSETAIDGAVPEQADDWLRAVYSDTTLVTQRRPDAVTSSGTMPGLIALMLQALDVDDGATVMQAGTGTGYTAALLCERLGSDRVVSIDVDPQLTHPAGQRLHSCGYHPKVVTADAISGYPPQAPYDRIMATFALPTIPSAWLQQTHDGGIVLAPIRSAFARLRVHDGPVAEGRFLASGAYFMRYRASAEGASAAARPPLPSRDSPWTRSAPRLPSSVVWDNHFKFIVDLTLPELDIGHCAGGLHDVVLTTPDGSRASHSPDGELYQTGRRRLWDEVEVAHSRWQEWGEPHRERFGLTATPDEQWAWLDTPDSKHLWPLSWPASHSGRHP